mmetsp:Transcript_116387/g.205809  ORF Transcript_116387/g.205809 Transcript_116387/m.205809 type:complete len:237 (-) Transcript_116387:103-813(-)
MESQQSQVCCCVCCFAQRAVTIYTSIFIGFWILGFYHFAPLPGAGFGLTFITDDVVDDANAYCAGSVCNQLCDCNGSPCDMTEDISTFRGFGFYYFIVYLLILPVLLMGLISAAMEKPTLLGYFMVAVPIHQFMVAIAGVGFSLAPTKAIRAWYLRNAVEDFDDHEAACTDSWFEDFDDVRTAGIIWQWSLWCIGVCILAHMVYSAKRARDDLVNANSCVKIATTGKPIIIGVAPQ